MKIKSAELLMTCGLPRSGTSLVQKILDNHPEVSAGPEFDHLNEIFSLYKSMKNGIENDRQKDYYNRMVLDKLFKSFFDALFESRAKPGIKIISEKTPSNTLILKDYLEFSCDAKSIVVLRNPYSILASMKRVYKKSKQLKSKVNVGKSVVNDCILLSRYYNSIEEGLNYADGRLHFVYYEELIEKPAIIVASICHFLNIEFNEEMLDTSKSNESSSLIGNSNNAWYSSKEYDRVIDTSSLDKWQSEISYFERIYIQTKIGSLQTSFLGKYGIKKQYNLLGKVIELSFRFKNKLRV